MVLSERMTWDEIRAQFPDQSVLLVECEWCADEVRTACVATVDPSEDDWDILRPNQRTGWHHTAAPIEVKTCWFPWKYTFSTREKT
jgi:hypothetical protein